MSHGPGQIEKRIGELFAATQDRALSVADICDAAFALDGATASRAQRLSATRAAHRILKRGTAASEKVREPLEQAIAAASAILGRAPGGRGHGEKMYFSYGKHWHPVDEKFATVMETTPSWPAYQQEWVALGRELKRWTGVSVNWCATETADRRLWFHPADYPVRVWAVDIMRDGVVWADAEVGAITDTWVNVRYQPDE
jgi:hypothetical protein